MVYASTVSPVVGISYLMCVEFGRMHDWTAVTTYSVKTFKTCAYQQISELERYE